MKTKLLLLPVAMLLAQLSIAQNDKPVIVNRAPGNAALKTPLAFKRFELADAKKDGKALKATDKIKTATGKEITVEDYLSRVNEVEQEISKRGYTLRNFEPGSSSLKYKPVKLVDTDIERLNVQINSGRKAPLSQQQRTNLLFKKKTTTNASASGTTKALNPAVTGQSKVNTGQLSALKKVEKKIEEEVSITELLKPLTDRIQESIGADGAKFNLANASLKVTSHAIRPLGADIENNMTSTLSEYRVAVNFNANVSGSFGLPFNITIPMATMKGEFTARANAGQRHERKVVVNLMGRSFFNKTGAISGDSFSEEDEEELQLSELLANRSFSSISFMDWLPSMGINTSFTMGGSVGCSYHVEMDRNGVSAFIGPTYGTTVRVSASYGYRDVIEGGIEGIVTLLKGGIGFGGSAGLEKQEGVWRLKNLSSVEATLEALKGEINLFVRYPDLSNWNCWGPCITKKTFPLFETPTAFRLTGTLLESDKGVNLDWQ
ncbi:MAG: hypothetical protein KA821_09135 [Chitinophagaceae bacterium]|nr:hypothetical protein [Chitinophagaceae bacterium]